mgnify:CR=1 FL=1|jgi:magnesium-transporting ATPase (P-type)
MANEGLRVIGFAIKTWDSIPQEISIETIENDLIFLGLA